MTVVKMRGRIRVMDINKILRTNLKRIRLEHGLTQDALSKMTKIRPTYYSAYERGLKNFGKNFQAKVCRALKIKIAEFYYEPDDDEKKASNSD